MKFRNIALRGPWTSGGIEFNFGVIGHTPSTATPVDYVLRENPDGSVSCWVGSDGPAVPDPLAGGDPAAAGPRLRSRPTCCGTTPLRWSSPTTTG